MEAINNIFNKNINNIKLYLSSNSLNYLSRELAFDEQQKQMQYGIARERTNNGFTYYYIKDENPVSKKDLKRIELLKIPPSWEYD